MGSVDNGPAWGNSGAWGGNSGAWGGNSPAWSNSPAWGGNSGAWGGNSPAWGGNSPAWGGNSPAWGGNSPAWGGNSPAWGGNSPVWGNDVGPWGGDGAEWGDDNVAWGPGGDAWGEDITFAFPNYVMLYPADPTFFDGATDCATLTPRRWGFRESRIVNGQVVVSDVEITTEDGMTRPLAMGETLVGAACGRNTRGEFAELTVEITRVSTLSLASDGTFQHPIFRLRVCDDPDEGFAINFHAAEFSSAIFIDENGGIREFAGAMTPLRPALPGPDPDFPTDYAGANAIPDVRAKVALYSEIPLGPDNALVSMRGDVLGGSLVSFVVALAMSNVGWPVDPMDANRRNFTPFTVTGEIVNVTGVFGSGEPLSYPAAIRMATGRTLVPALAMSDYERMSPWKLDSIQGLPTGWGMPDDQMVMAPSLVGYGQSMRRLMEYQFGNIADEDAGDYVDQLQQGIMGQRWQGLIGDVDGHMQALDFFTSPDRSMRRTDLLVLMTAVTDPGIIDDEEMTPTKCMDRSCLGPMLSQPFCDDTVCQESLGETSENCPFDCTGNL